MNGPSKQLGFFLKEWPKSHRERQAYIDPIFDTIAARYDFMTRVLSFGQEQAWKKKAVGMITRNGSPTRILDLATGTGDFPLLIREAGFGAQLLGLDCNAKMLGIALQTCAHQPGINFILGDLMETPLKDQSFDAITMGYGLRYVTDIRQTLSEVFRLLRRGGTFVCLDFGLPNNRLYRNACFGYLLVLGSLWGLALHRKADTYWHIVESLKAFPGQEIIRGWLQEVGFAKIGLQNQMGGIIAILSGIKP